MSIVDTLRGREKPQSKKSGQEPVNLPRVAVPPAPPPTPASAPRSYDQQALNFAQRLIDDQAEMERLKVDLDTWRGRALAAEEQMRRLEERIDADRKVYDAHVRQTTDNHDRAIATLSAARQNDVDRLTGERDHFKLRYARTVERLHVAGKIVLDALQVDPLPTPEPQQPLKVDMHAMEDEITRPMGPEVLDRAGAGEDKPIDTREGYSKDGRNHLSES